MYPINFFAAEDYASINWIILDKEHTLFGGEEGHGKKMVNDHVRFERCMARVYDGRSDRSISTAVARLARRNEPSDVAFAVGGGRGYFVRIHVLPCCGCRICENKTVDRSDHRNTYE
ncbi:hypothetical protein D3C77_295830 [compost metagenome]